jgi:hypothetical protein
MFVSVCDRPLVAEPTEAQDRAVMETMSSTIHRKMPMPARQLPITGSAHKAGAVGDAPLAAVLAGFDMPAERRGAAVLDRRHDLELLQAQMPCMGGPVGGPGSAEDVGDLDRGAHGSAVGRDHLSRLEQAELVERARHRSHRAGCDLGVEGGAI